MQELEKSMVLDMHIQQTIAEVSVTQSVHQEEEKPRVSRMKTMKKSGINQSLVHLQNLSQFNPNNNATIDLLYSYES